ncbi:RNA polymerase sigma factor [Streptacidiphilus sp. MAP12-16]|uniref:RNA polymerase sigma factor n=1 Tax=Streptacidiphilus sp. MAP12-16 TaxID=3156300 RepID=UPI0035191FCB
MRPAAPPEGEVTVRRPPGPGGPGAWGSAIEDSGRHGADVELFRELHAAGFAGVRYEVFRGELAAYGRPLLRKWIFTGEIYRHSAERGHPVTLTEDLRALLREDGDAREQLAHDAVVAGLALFHRRALHEGLWNPALGASLRSFFVGAVVLAFKDTFKRWARDYAHLARERLTDEGDDIDRWLSLIATSTTLEAEVVGRDTITSYLATLDETNRSIVELRLNGVPPGEIAAQLAIPAARVRTRLYRLRSTLRNDLQEGGLL